MIIDARSIPSGTEITSDLCIVGGGAAVISIAQAFSESANKIALVESAGTNLTRTLNLSTTPVSWDSIRGIR